MAFQPANGRWRSLACAAAAAALLGWAADPAAAGPPAKAVVSAAASASGRAARRAHLPGSVCGTNQAGDLVSCPRPIPRAQWPAGARNQAVVSGPVKNLAALVDTRTWTSSGGNTFPGADMPFGLVQWSPDTVPHRNTGGGYTFKDHKLWGYSLTHVSGPGCRAAGDIPILPMTGPMPRGDLTAVTTPFTNVGELAQAGYYSARSNGRQTITSQFTATTHAAMARFTFPRTNEADFLFKLYGSERADFAPSAEIIGSREVAGSVTTGGFCDEGNSYGHQQYTVHFDIIFSRPFTAAHIATEPGKRYPGSVFLTFDTTADRVVQAHVAISYVSVANARANRARELSGWDFGYYKVKAQRAWNRLLGEIKVWGGSYAQTQQFYSLLYKDLLEPNIISDVNGQYVGSDQKVHTLARGQANQYGMFSGWDIYHSLAQLQAMLDPTAASDMAQSLVNYYGQNGILPQWSYLNLDDYVMVGDPADAIIADYYAFGARHFDTAKALTDMLAQIGAGNPVRPGQAAIDKYGYLPQNTGYGCCHLHGVVAALLEYDNADLALSRFAAALGRPPAAASLARQSGDWANLFDSGNDLLTARRSDGTFLTGVTPTTSANYVEGDAEEYLWDVPDDYAGLFTLLGGDAKVVPELVSYLSRPDARGNYAYLDNEFDLGEQFALDYAGDPAGTQLAVSTVRDDLYRPGPDGLANNDDLGAESSQFIWEMLGLYPENPGTPALVLTSPGFPHAVISPPGRNAITINAPQAGPHRFYVQSLTINDIPDTRLYAWFGQLAARANLDWTLTNPPTAWGTAPTDAPPSY
jgi:predicted alpha-1,2-mannosidase